MFIVVFLHGTGVQSTDAAKLTDDITSPILKDSIVPHSAVVSRPQRYLTLTCKIFFYRVSHMASHSNDGTVSTGRKSGSASLAQILTDLGSNCRAEMSLFQL